MLLNSHTTLLSLSNTCLIPLMPPHGPVAVVYSLLASLIASLSGTTVSLKQAQTAQRQGCKGRQTQWKSMSIVNALQGHIILVKRIKISEEADTLHNCYFIWKVKIGTISYLLSPQMDCILFSSLSDFFHLTFTQ